VKHETRARRAKSTAHSTRVTAHNTRGAQESSPTKHQTQLSKTEMRCALCVFPNKSTALYWRSILEPRLLRNTQNQNRNRI
jgi:hypothetical protein